MELLDDSRLRRHGKGANAVVLERTFDCQGIWPGNYG